VTTDSQQHQFHRDNTENSGTGPGLLSEIAAEVTTN
jgi:hypothetical protein